MHHNQLCQTVTPLQSRKPHLTSAQNALQRVNLQHVRTDSGWAGQYCLGGWCAGMKYPQFVHRVEVRTHLLLRGAMHLGGKKCVQITFNAIFSLGQLLRFLCFESHIWGRPEKWAAPPGWVGSNHNRYSGALKPNMYRCGGSPNLVHVMLICSSNRDESKKSTQL